MYYFDENEVKTKLDCGGPDVKGNGLVENNAQLESNYSDILGRLKLILSEKTDELNCMMALSEQLRERKADADARDMIKGEEFNGIESGDEEVMFHSPKGNFFM